MVTFKREDIFFSKPTVGKGASFEVFSKIKHFLQDFIGLCSDGVQPVSGRNADCRHWEEKIPEPTLCAA